MPEPRFDFCLAVVREHCPVGFVLKKIFLVYVPELSQQEHVRNAWLRKKSTFGNIAYQTRTLLGDVVLHRRTDKTSVGSLHLWAVVPMMWVTDPYLIKRVEFERVFPTIETKIFSEAQIDALLLSNFFRRICRDFNKRGGGQYLLRYNQKEVSKYFV